MSWDPDAYLRFADLRTRPGIELMARIPEVDARRVVDLGAGTGHLTAMLARRWPDAEVTGVESSAAMVDRARTEHPTVRWHRGDIAAWEPDGPVDVLFSNAALHWLDDHERLFTRLRSWLTPGGVLAVQMPDNWAAPTHRVPAEVLDDGTWPDDVRAALLRDRLAAPGAYRRRVQPATVDLWRTTYFQALSGADPVWEWVTGSVLRPVLDRLEGSELDRFTSRVQAGYRSAYPPDADGTTVLAFSRLFLVAAAPPGA